MGIRIKSSVYFAAAMTLVAASSVLSPGLRLPFHLVIAIVSVIAAATLGYYVGVFYDRQRLHHAALRLALYPLLVLVVAVLIASFSLLIALVIWRQPLGTSGEIPALGMWLIPQGIYSTGSFLEDVWPPIFATFFVVGVLLSRIGVRI